MVQEPPDLEDPKQTRPFIVTRDVVPSLSQFYTMPLERNATATTLNITVPIQSEDLGEPVDVGVHLDLLTNRRFLTAARGIEPRSFSDGPRDVKIDVPISVYGCHYVTAIFAHESSFNKNPADGLVPKEFWSDSSTVIWTINVFDPAADPPTDPKLLVDCPHSDTPED